MEDLVTEPDAGFWRDRPVAITGATGFLGSHLTDELRTLGAEIVVLVRDDVPPTPIVDRWRGRVSEVQGDVRDQELLERLFGEYEVTTVFHLAAQTQVGVANRNPISTFDSNIRGTWAVLEACRRSPEVAHVVVASSDKAYGDQPELPYTEDMELRATHPYDVSKACSDMLAASYHQAFGVPAAVTRCGNFFGPGDTNWARLVPSSMRSLLRGERPLIRSDGTPTRDYLHVRDGALAYVRLAEALAADPGLAGQAFNFSTESPMSVLELVELIGKVAGRTDLKPDVRASATNEIADQFLSAAKARRLLGWSPRFTMEDALADTLAWYRDFLGI